jgi:hypothetical protein
MPRNGPGQSELNPVLVVWVRTMARRPRHPVGLRWPAVPGAGLQRAPLKRISYPRGASEARVQSSPPQNNPPKTQPSIRSTSALFSEMFDE